MTSGGSVKASSWKPEPEPEPEAGNEQSAPMAGAKICEKKIPTYFGVARISKDAEEEAQADEREGKIYTHQQSKNAQ